MSAWVYVGTGMPVPSSLGVPSSLSSVTPMVNSCISSRAKFSLGRNPLLFRFVVKPVLIFAEKRRKGVLGEQVLERSERVVAEHLMKGRIRIGARSVADDENLVPHVRHAHAHLVGPRLRLAVELPPDGPGRDAVSMAILRGRHRGCCVVDALRRIVGRDEERVLRVAGHIFRELVVQPCFDAAFPDLVDELLGRPEGGLLEQPHDVALRRRRGSVANRRRSLGRKPFARRSRVRARVRGEPIAVVPSACEDGVGIRWASAAHLFARVEDAAIGRAVVRVALPDSHTATR